MVSNAAVIARKCDSGIALQNDGILTLSNQSFWKKRRSWQLRRGRLYLGQQQRSFVPKARKQDLQQRYNLRSLGHRLTTLRVRKGLPSPCVVVGCLKWVARMFRLAFPDESKAG